MSFPAREHVPPPAPGLRVVPAPPGLVAFVAGLSSVRTMADLTRATTQAVRNLLGADGATFVLREDDRCVYVEEDAISPLWKGSRFPLNSCISGWAMLHREAVAIRDVFQDSRVPLDAYRPTFVRSLIMAPVRRERPIAALGAYWSATRDISDDEVELLQAIADATALAVAFVSLNASPDRAPDQPRPLSVTVAPPEDARLPGLFERTRRRLRPESRAAYGLAFGLVGLATLARWGLDVAMGPGLAPFVTYYPVVLFAKLFGGTRPALFAAAASALVADWAFMRPETGLSALIAPAHLFNVALFLTTSVLMVWMLTRYRRAMSRLIDEDAQHLGLAREIQHRMRNALSVIQTIINQSLRSDPAQADLLNRRIWAGVSDLTLDAASTTPSGLRHLVADQLEGFDLARFDLDGDDATLPRDQSSVLALALHELATNATKYGALSGPDGRVSLRWATGTDWRTFEWRESGGPPVAPPTRRGYGAVFLGRLLNASGGSLAVDYDPAGVSATMTLPRAPSRP